MTTSPLTLNSLVEFDCPFTVTNGDLSDSDAYAPSVFHDDETDISIDSSLWEAFSTGYTGQHGYNGPVMHSSEQLGGKLARDILDNDGTYVICAVEVWGDDGEIESTPAGWIVLTLKEVDGAPCCLDPECNGSPCTFPGYADNH